MDIGFGGSGRNVGLVNAGMWVMPEALPGELGDIFGARLLKLLGDGPSPMNERSSTIVSRIVLGTVLAIVLAVLALYGAILVYVEMR